MSMLKSKLRNMLTIAFVIALACLTSITAFAKTNAPYGFTYDDSASGKTIYQYYSYSQALNRYVPTCKFYSNGLYVYTENGVLVCNTSAGSGSRYNGFDEKGNFYIVTSSGQLTCIDSRKQTKVLLESGTVKLNYNSDDIAITVSTTSGTKSLSTLEIVPDSDNDDDYTTPVVTKSKNRVDVYTNSANELVYEAFNNGKVKTQIIVSNNGKKVLNATNGVRLSDTLVGAKFLGFDSSYNVYLYENNGTLYRFKSGSWYSAEKLSLSGTYKNFKKDENGFISKIVSTNGSYTIKQLTNSNKWKANKTYTVKKSGYITLYTKGSSKSNTLTLKSRHLSLNGKKIATGVTKYGFTSSRKIIYIKNGKAYTSTLSNPSKAKKVCLKAKNLTTNKYGLVTKVVMAQGSKKVS